MILQWLLLKSIFNFPIIIYKMKSCVISDTTIHFHTIHYNVNAKTMILILFRQCEYIKSDELLIFPYLTLDS